MTHYLKFWGKAHDACDPCWHPLAYHAMDVAAVTREYLEANPLVLKQLAKLGGLTEEEALYLMTFLAGAHDVGKFSPGFQAKVDALYPVELLGAVRPAEVHDHQVMGVSLLVSWLAGRFPAGGLSRERVLERLANLACAHHGRPVTHYANLFRAFPVAQQAASDFLLDVWCLSEMDKVPVQFFSSQQAVREFSWLAAGVVTLADWVGSSRTKFAYQEAGLSLGDYYSAARAKARAALCDDQLIEAPRAHRGGFDALFGAHTPAGGSMTPTPLQAYADSVTLPAEPTPQLFILEDETGAGKTEAALTLASRLLAAGFARGLFFCLPTQTTANAVFHRIAPLTRLLFGEEANPALSLAHGQAKLALEMLCQDEQFADSLSRQLGGWAQERNKTALLADVGVGTIDQVVLAGLPARHATLRTLGLAKKVLIVDEAHACDTYQLGLLAAVLEEHARLGGSAVILSATLPRSIKARLVSAFNKGLSGTQVTLCASEYPLATKVSEGEVLETPIAARREPRTLRFKGITDTAIPGLIERWVSQGKCICILRNTVARAQEEFDRLNEIYPGQVMLVHARFMTGHRIENDQRLLRTFGKQSSAATRRGQIVIATQVVEASLDIDFDELITDIAPIDSLLQRAGRWRRHIRDAQGNLKESGGLDDREAGPVYVVAPFPSSEAFIGQLPKGTPFVYPDVAVLWRTAQVVRDWQELEVPGQVRGAVDFAYPEAEGDIPGWLEAWADHHKGEQLAAAQLAYGSTVNWDAGYHPQAGIEEGERAVTRLGEVSVSVVLCDKSGRTLLEGDSLSQLALRFAQVGGEPLVEGRIRLRLSRDESTGVWIGAARAGAPSSKEFTVKYSHTRGLSLTS